MENEIQFDQVQRPAGATTCSACHGALFDSYYQANGKILCERCAGNIRNYFQSTEGAAGRLAKAAVFGLGGGIAGGVAYTLVLAFANINAALITILIGWLVGKGVRKGSGGRGGIECQIMAVAITYLIIGLSIMVSAIISHEGAQLGTMQIVVIAVQGAFTAPIENATSSILGGIITLFGLMQAWRLTAPAQVVITGPHALATASQSVAPAAQPPPTPSA